MSITLTRAAASSNARTRQFIDAATQSVVVSLATVDGLPPAVGTVEPVTVNIGTASSSGCSTVSSSLSSTTTCSFSIGAVIGTDVYSIVAYAQTNGSGATLSTGTTSLSITQGGANAATLALSGVVATAQFSITPANTIGGVAATAALTLTAKDAAGNVIVGSAPFSSPIPVQESDATGGITMSAPAFTAPNDTITVTYNGTPATSSTTFSATGLVSATPATLAIPPPHQSLYLLDNHANAISIFAPGSNGNVAPIRVITGAATGLSSPTGIALDTTGNIYVGNRPTGGDGSITVYAPDANGNATPARTITGSATTMSAPFGPWGVAVDANGNIWAQIWNVTNFNGGSTIEFAAGANGNAAPIATIAGSNALNSDANDVSFDRSGNMHVAGTTPNATLTYAAGANGNVAPLRAITGLLAFPNAAHPTSPNPGVIFQQAYDANGNVLVTDDANATGVVSFWPLTASGNIAPTAQLGGTNTLFGRGIRGIAVDAAGFIYVSNVFNGTTPITGAVFVFSPGAQGNVAPVRTIRGTETGIVYPEFIAINP